MSFTQHERNFETGKEECAVRFFQFAFFQTRPISAFETVRLDPL